MTFDKSVNHEKYMSYLRKLRQKYPFDKLALFVDQLYVHKMDKVKALLKEL